MRRLASVLDALDARTGYRSARRHLLDEALPHGTGWWFVTGAVLLFLLAVQLVTGLVLALYYVPSPEYAYESVRFIIDRLPFGALVRGLHVFGASFVVVAAVIHMLRVVLFGSYKAPREVTWMTGVVLLLIVLGFGLSGYLLRGDQRGYWAMVVTINIAGSTPLVGEWIASMLRGGTEVGALALLRWYALHVFLLPAALVAFVAAHLYLMRRHGISGPVTPLAGPPTAFYPQHAIKDTLAMAMVFAVLFALAATVPLPLDAMADPTDADFVPRPEWYFLSLFQLLEYFPGPLEPVATVVIPGLVVTALLLLPFLDRSPHRDPGRRRLVMTAFALVGGAVVVLTYLGFQDSPAHADPSRWQPLAIAGREFVEDERCRTCHRPGGAASPLAQTRLRRDPAWLLGHVEDPEMIAPGLREPPRGGMNESQAIAILSYMRRASAGGEPPPLAADVRLAIRVLGRDCARCHEIDGEGGTQGPDLTHAGAERDAAWLRDWISDPEAMDSFADMPGFGDRLSDEEMSALVAYLAARK